jgi:hypothetical protein
VTARFHATQRLDPIFRTNDGSNCDHNIDTSTLDGRRKAYGLLINKGLIRIALPVPATAKFNVIGVLNPYGCGDVTSPLDVSYLPVITLQHKTTLEIKTTDRGRALVTGLWKDVGRLNGPILRGLTSRAPYVKCCGLLTGPRAAGTFGRHHRPSRSAAATRASRRSKTAGIASAPASSFSWINGSGHDRFARAARAGCWCARLQGKGADRLVTRIDPGVVSSPHSAATSARPPRNWARGRRTTRSAR